MIIVQHGFGAQHGHKVSDNNVSCHFRHDRAILGLLYDVSVIAGQIDANHCTILGLKNSLCKSS